MDYSEQTWDSAFAVKRFSHRARFKRYANFLIQNSNPKFNKKFLDYGAGDGYVFNYVRTVGVTGLTLSAYEPVEQQFKQLCKNVQDNHLDVECLNALSADQRYDLVLCAEVLEHFSAQNVLNHLNLLKTLLNQSGKLLISVPIEIGLAGLAKNLVRALIGQTHGGTSSRDLCNAFLDKPIYRGDNEYIHSHIGFSYKKLEYLIVESGFSIDAKYFSPFPFLRSVANSQVFFECSIG